MRDEKDGNKGATFVAVWPLDADVNYRTAVAEGERRLERMCQLAGVRRLGPVCWSVTDNTAGLDSDLALVAAVSAAAVADFDALDFPICEPLAVFA